MARKKIREYDAKKIISENLPNVNFKSILITAETNLNTLPEKYPWLNEKIVAKPDQCFGKRKKHDLVFIGSFAEAKNFIAENMNRNITIGKATDKLTNFLLEPFIEHEKEYYLSFVSKRNSDVIYFSEEGGVDIEENWDNVKSLEIPTLSEINGEKISDLITNDQIKAFIQESFKVFRKLDFAYLEFNPFTIKENEIFLLDTVAQIDDCAAFKNQKTWQHLEFPQEFGKIKFREEKHIEDLDKISGASLKLTILNPTGKIWNILGGGGASIIYLDMIANLGKGNEIANYGESSGNPSTEESYQYAKSILELMIKNNGKILFVVGGIANFTDVRNTFNGFSKALLEFKEQLKKNEIKVFVRRGGPYYEEGLKQIKETAEEIGITCHVHGPETSMPKIIQIAKESL
ncbi:MAG: ATP citrate lyase citrate-binding domain-containing protein [Candidatus Woesearchaeota archaeon]